MSLDDFRLVVDVHLMGADRTAPRPWETMKTQQFGRIVFTTSSSGLFGNFGQANYGAKMALVGLMQTFVTGRRKHPGELPGPTAATQNDRGHSHA